MQPVSCRLVASNVMCHKECVDVHRERKRRGVSVQEQLSCCSLCQDVLKDPVSTSCGHWFCRQCITSYWDQSASSGDSSCPQCGKDPEQDLDCRQTVRAALYKVRLNICLLMSSYLKTGQESTSSIMLKMNAVTHISF